MSAPTLLPTKKREERRVFLELELWDELSDIADFHSKVFEEMKADEKVSRNDIIAAFMQWAVDAYWEDKGGKPSKSERAEKARQHAEKLSKAKK